MVTESTFSKSVEDVDLGVWLWLLGFAKSSSPGEKCCCIQDQPVARLSVYWPQAHAHVNSTYTHIHTHSWTGQHRQTHLAHTQIQTTPMALFCSPLWLRKIWQRDLGDTMIAAYTAWRENYKDKGKKHFTIVPGDITNSNGCIWQLGCFTRRALLHQSWLPKERWSMPRRRLSSCSLAKPRLTQPSVVLLERRRLRSNEPRIALQPAGQGLTSPPAPNPIVSQWGKWGRLGGTTRFSQESRQVCSGKADPRSAGTTVCRSGSRWAETWLETSTPTAQLRQGLKAPGSAWNGAPGPWAE